jgi:hypothetical protein
MARKADAYAITATCPIENVGVMEHFNSEPVLG